MDHLVGPEVQVVLNLKEGKGFDKVINPTCVSATLNGLSLETDFINPEPCPQYATNLVWEASKSTLRKMRSGQEPLKVECFEIRENGSKDKIGYLMLSLRTAQIIPKDYDGDIKADWHKLLGLRSDIRADKPEFLLSLIIGEKDGVEGVTLNKEKSTDDNAIDTDNLSMPYLIHEERLIQLGPVNTCRDIFLFSIITESIYNLDALKTKSSKIDKPYTLWYDILNNEVLSKPFPTNVQMFSLNEKIVIRIRSSLTELKNYLECEPHFLVLLKHGESVLGQSEIDLRPLIPTENVQEFLLNTDGGSTVVCERCILNNLENKDEFFSQDKLPHVDIKLKLQYVGMKSLFNCYSDQVFMTQTSSDINCHHYADEDCMCGVHNKKPTCCIDKLEHSPVDCAQRCTENSHVCNKIIDEFETWKAHQQELFKLELKQKEERHLNRLSEEWQKRREYLESKFQCNVEQCKILANSLNTATDDLRTRKFHSLENEARLIKTNEELKWKYEKKLQHLNDALQKMQQDLNVKLSLLEGEKKNLQVQLESVKTENKELQAVIKKQSDELETIKKSSLMQDQAVSLVDEIKNLKRKLEGAQKSKTFFKEQWGKAVREIHKMKMEHRQAIEVQIKTSKDELKNNLEDILQADTAALTNDKILLNQIQREIDVIRPNPSLYSSRNPRDTEFLSTYNSRSLINLSKPSYLTCSEQESRLRKLTEERDSLLRTGSYTIDDAIIVKLNAEIRSLLMNS